MVICGIKLSHDGGVAVIKNDKLIFSTEIEKIDNNLRYSEIEDNSIIAEILKKNGFKISDIDHFVVDGWTRGEIKIGESDLSVAPYTEILNNDVLEEYKLKGLKINKHSLKYSSFMHVAGHLAGAYCTSPFAKKKKDSYILVWDGGTFPRLYFYNYNLNKVENLGEIFLLYGDIYCEFGQFCDEFKIDSVPSVAGKLMAYIALGKPEETMVDLFDNIYNIFYEKRPRTGYENFFYQEFIKNMPGVADEDMLASLHLFIEKLIIKGLADKLKRFPHKTNNLCYAGGCALNIKWNSAIRNSGLFKNIYIPPFPNDSGSAIGTACCKMMSMGSRELSWNVYSGPQIIKNSPATGWKIRNNFSIKQLAKLLHEKGDPVVILKGRAELGPRALGHRSIVAPVHSKNTKELLNSIKQRKFYRPIAPICIEEKASNFFHPGTRDPFMLFEHKVISKYKNLIPAVLHLDDTARLQTISRKDDDGIHCLLREYEKLSGFSILCNTSANYKSRGFFPDIYSATKWGGTNYVWLENVLYEKTI